MRLAQGHNTVLPEWGSNPQPLDPESEALTTRPQCSPIIFCCLIVGSYAKIARQSTLLANRNISHLSFNFFDRRVIFN